MDKKLYIVPSTEVIVIGSSQYLMAGSPNLSNKDYNGGQVLSDEYYDFEDEEDEEELDW